VHSFEENCTNKPEHQTIPETPIILRPSKAGKYPQTK
jgi:hypothetical protein